MNCMERTKTEAGVKITVITAIMMEEMIEGCVPMMAGANSGMSEEEARNMMKQFFPELKRWKKAPVNPE